MNIHKTYKYSVTLRQRTFNYNNFAEYLSSNDNLHCFCNDPLYSQYVNSTHGHIITGNLNIVRNDSLRLLMNYGTMFRIPSKYNVNIASIQFKLKFFFIY